MIGAFLRRLGEVLRDAFRIWWLAPLIPLIAVIPEFAQHVAEIELGMFANISAARALSEDPTRWAFGYVKLAGYLIAILAAVRFWAARRAGQNWFSLRGIAWRVFGIGLGLNLLVALGGMALETAVAGLADPAGAAVTTLFMIVTLPLVVLLVAGLVGDREATIASVYRGGWAAVLRIALFSAAVLAPLMWLHGTNHRLAIGAEPGIVWALMVFDSLVVGLLAAGWGTAIAHGYRPLREKPRSDPVSRSDAITTE